MKNNKTTVAKKILAATLSAVMPLGALALGACTDTEPKPNPDAHLHTLAMTAAVDATCTSAGNSEYWHCNDCGKYFADSKGDREITLADTAVAAKGHGTVKVDATPAQCIIDGTIEHWHCNNGCGKDYADAAATQELTAEQLKISATGVHNAVKVDGTPADCTHDGTADYWHCSGCGLDFTSADATTEITEDEKTIAAHHTLAHRAAVPVSWSADGKAEYWECGGCGKLFADENAATVTTEAALTVAREQTPTGGTVINQGAENQKDNASFFNADKWATFGSSNYGSYSNGSAKPELKGEEGAQYLEFTKAARFELFHVKGTGGAITHIAESSTASGKWKEEAYAEHYNKTYIYTFDVTSNGAFAFEVFGLASSKADRSGQGTSLLFDGNTVEFYAPPYSSNNGLNQTKRAVATLSNEFDFGDGQHHSIAISINRSEVVDGESAMDYRIYVDGYMLVFENLENISGNNAAKADGSLNITFGSAGMGQRLDVIPQVNSADGAETATYSTVRIHALEITRHGDTAEA